MVIIGLVLQGVCWDFFFTVADIYADKKAGPNIKAQAQSLRFIASNGVGLFFASSVCGYIFNSHVTAPNEAGVQWETFWYFPAVIAGIVFIAFFFLFKDDVSMKKEHYHKDLEEKA